MRYLFFISIIVFSNYSMANNFSRKGYVCQSRAIIFNSSNEVIHSVREMPFSGISNFTTTGTQTIIHTIGADNKIYDFEIGVQAGLVNNIENTFQAFDVLHIIKNGEESYLNSVSFLPNNIPDYVQVKNWKQFEIGNGSKVSFSLSCIRN